MARKCSRITPIQAGILALPLVTATSATASLTNHLLGITDKSLFVSQAANGAFWGALLAYGYGASVGRGAVAGVAVTLATKIAVEAYYRRAGGASLEPAEAAPVIIRGFGIGVLTAGAVAAASTYVWPGERCLAS